MKRSAEAQSRYAFPRPLPKTLRSLHKFHSKLLELTMRAELRQRVLKAAVAAITAEMQKYSPHAADPQDGRAARMALAELNALRREFDRELLDLGSDIAMLHNSNYLVVRAVLRGGGHGELVAERESRSPTPGSNLLHEPGWVREVAIAKGLAERGKAAFLTFGTPIDAGQCDMVVADKPLRRLKWTRSPWTPDVLKHLKR